MFNFFKNKNKNYKPIHDYPKDDWAIIDETSLGNPALIRINLGLKDAVAHPDYPIRMGIAIPVSEHNEKIMELKSKVEDYLNESFCKNDIGVLAVIITGLEDEKFIEFLSYTKSDLNFEEFHKILKNNFQDYEIQMYANHDRGWTGYKSFAHI